MKYSILVLTLLLTMKGYCQETEKVPFVVADRPPIFLEIEEDKKTLQRAFSSKLSTFVYKNFNTEIARDLGMTGRVRLSARFVITKDGSIDSVSVNTPHIELEHEMHRVLSLLPSVVGGRHDGKAIDIIYALPLVFQVH